MDCRATRTPQDLNRTVPVVGCAYGGLGRGPAPYLPPNLSALGRVGYRLKPTVSGGSRNWVRENRVRFYCNTTPQELTATVGLLCFGRFGCGDWRRPTCASARVSDPTTQRSAPI